MTSALDDRITKNVDYIVLIEKEKKARMESEITQGAGICLDIVNLFIINIFIIFILNF